MQDGFKEKESKNPKMRTPSIISRKNFQLAGKNQKEIKLHDGFTEKEGKSPKMRTPSVISRKKV